MRSVLAWLLIVVLAVGLAETVEAGKGGSSAGRSSSSGGGRSSSSGGGRSYSSGGRTSSPSSSPSSSSSGSRSYSSGGKSYSSGSKTSTPSTSGGTTSSGGAKSTPSGGTSASPASGGSSYSSGGSRSYSSGGSKSGPAATTPATGSSGTSASGGVSKKPSATSYDSLAATEQKKAESRREYQQAQTPQANYTTPTGKKVTIDQRDRQVEDLRRQLDHERWVNREDRMRVFYGSYYSRPVIYYNDPYGSFYWWWLLDQRLEYQALWAYHHRSVMDQVRYNDLLAKNAQLAERVRQLEQSNLQRDPTYVPPGVERDLVYSDRYVDAVYNPQPTAAPQPTFIAPPPAAATGVDRFFFWVFLLGMIACFVWLFVWLVFYKRWQI